MTPKSLANVVPELKLLPRDISTSLMIGHRRKASAQRISIEYSRSTAILCLRWLRLLLCLSAIFSSCCGSSNAQEAIDPRKEYNVKAVSLYAFGRYVTWPETAFQTADSPFVIGVLGDNPFGDALEQI